MGARVNGKPTDAGDGEREAAEDGCHTDAEGADEQRAEKQPIGAERDEQHDERGGARHRSPRETEGDRRPPAQLAVGGRVRM